MGIYSERVMEHFKNPHNKGKPEKYDAKGEVGNPICGDVMVIYIKVDNDIITDIGFETMGCAAAIATSSMVTDLAKGKTLEEAEKISNTAVADSLEGLPPIKMHCSNLAADGLKKAIQNYKMRQKAGEGKGEKEVKK